MDALCGKRSFGPDGRLHGVRERRRESRCGPATPPAPPLQRASVAHRSGRVPDLQQTDLAHVDARERVRDEGVQALLVDLDVEDAAPTRGDGHGLHAPLVLAHVAIDPGAVQDRADDMKVRVERRPGRDDPEADGVTGVGGQRVLDVLAGITVPGHPVGIHLLRLRHVERRHVAEPRGGEVPLAGDEDVLVVDGRQCLLGLDDDRAVHPVCDVREHRLRAAVVHVDARVVGNEAEGLRLARHDVRERDVRCDPGRVEVDRVRHRRVVLQRHLHRLALAHVDHRPGRAAVERPGAVLDAGGDGNRAVLDA